jgi:poly(ribitol-phosphate) beta-N-acetylglucosaminyltransferase
VTPKVSAIVPVYNPGRDIDDCIRTLLDQSLPASEYEVVFVDDGSTDETPARLDRLAAEHDNVRVEHIPNSGWPGRPRNVGIEMARGDFVYFLDNDDWIEHETLERVHRRAVEDAADVVVGKVVGHGPGKRVPKGIFRENRSGVTLEWPPLLWLMSPHKLFRRALLLEHGVRFPEGRMRLEDHLFVLHAYLHCQGRISVLADYTCYHWMFRGDVNASMTPFDPVEYYGYVRQVLDLIDEHAEGELRDRLYLHYFRGKLLGRVGEKPFLRWKEEYRRLRYEEIRQLVLERFGEHLDPMLPLNLRVRARLLREGRYESLKRLTRIETRLRPEVMLREVAEDGDGLVVRMRATLRARRDALVAFEQQGERLLWTPPEEIDGLPREPIDVTDAIRTSRPYVFLENLADHSDFALPVDPEIELEPTPAGTGRVRPVFDITTRICARTGAAGAPLPPGEWQVRASTNFGGFKATGDLRRDDDPAPVVFRVTRDGRVTERRAPLGHWVRHHVARRVPWLARQVRRARPAPMRRPPD